MKTGKTLLLAGWTYINIGKLNRRDKDNHLHATSWLAKWGNICTRTLCSEISWGIITGALSFSPKFYGINNFTDIYINLSAFF